MGMYFLTYWHFILMITLMMILSIVISFRFPRFPFYIVLIGSGLIGYVYAVMVNLEEFSFNLIAANVYATFIATLLVKWGYYLRKKADEMEMHIIDNGDFAALRNSIKQK